MGGKIRVELDYAGFTEYRRSPEVRALLDSEAERIANNANRMRGRKKAKYSSASSRDSRFGSVAAARADNGEAAYDNSRYRTLLRATSAGGA